jgi:hypothetical protein
MVRALSAAGEAMRAGHDPGVSAYMISRVPVRDSEAMERYVAEAPATVAPFGGRQDVSGHSCPACTACLPVTV